MSSKYEREIEEILRKFGDPQPTVTDRIRAINQRPARIRRSPTISFNHETGLVLGVILAFAAATLRWILSDPTSIQDLIIGIIAVAAAVVIVVALALAWINGNTPRTAWRGQPLNQGGRGPSRTPFSLIRTRVNLFKLRLGYRRRK